MKYRRIAFQTLAAIVLLLMVVSFLLVVEHERTQAELGAVFSGAFSELVLHSSEDSREPHEIFIVLQGYTPDPWATTNFRRTLVFDPQATFAQSSRTTRASFVMNNLFVTDLHAELQLPKGARSAFIGRKEMDRMNEAEFQARFPNNAGYYVVSQPGLNLSKDEAVFYFDHFCSGLCGGGGYVLMRKVNGVWHVVDQHTIWES